MLPRGFSAVPPLSVCARAFFSHCVVSPSHRQAAQSDLQDMLRTAVGEERRMVARALCAAKGDSFASDQARR